MALNQQIDMLKKQIDVFNDVFKGDVEIKKDLDEQYKKLTETPDINSITWWRKLIDHAENAIILIQKSNVIKRFEHDMNQIYKKRSISNVIDLCKDEDDDTIVQPSKRQKTNVEDTPTIEDTPTVEDTPTIEEISTVEDTPTVEEIPNDVEDASTVEDASGVFDADAKVLITAITHKSGFDVKYRLKYNEIILFSSGRKDFLYHVDGDLRFDGVESKSYLVEGYCRVDASGRQGFQKFTNSNVWFNDYRVYGVNFKKELVSYQNALKFVGDTVTDLDNYDKHYSSVDGTSVRIHAHDDVNDEKVILKSITNSTKQSKYDITSHNGIIYLSQAEYTFDCDQELTFDFLVYQMNGYLCHFKKRDPKRPHEPLQPLPRNTFNFYGMNKFMNFQQHVVMNGKRVYGIYAGSLNNNDRLRKIKISNRIQLKRYRDATFKGLIEGRDCFDMLYEQIIDTGIKKFNMNWMDVDHWCKRLDQEKVFTLKMGFLKHWINHWMNHWVKHNQQKSNHVECTLKHKNTIITVKVNKDNSIECKCDNMLFYSWKVNDVVHWIDQVDRKRFQLSKKSDITEEIENVFKQRKYSYEIRNNIWCIFRNDSEFIFRKDTNENQVWFGMFRKFNCEPHINMKTCTTLRHHDIDNWFKTGNVPKCNNHLCRREKLYMSWVYLKDEKRHGYKCFDRKSNPFHVQCKCKNKNQKPYYETI